MSEDTATPVVIAIEIGDPALRDRLAALIGSVAGLRLAAPGEDADATRLAALEEQSK